MTLNTYRQCKAESISSTGVAELSVCSSRPKLLLLGYIYYTYVMTLQIQCFGNKHEVQNMSITIIINSPSTQM